VANTPNMDYCKFENTLRALRQCDNDFDANLDTNDSESEARQQILDLCESIVEQYSEVGFVKDVFID